MTPETRRARAATRAPQTQHRSHDQATPNDRRHKTVPQPVCLQYSADTRAFHEALAAAELLPLERALVAQALGAKPPAEPIPSALGVAGARALLRCEVRAAIERRVEALAPGAYRDPCTFRPGSAEWRRCGELIRLEDMALAALRGEATALLGSEVRGLLRAIPVDYGRDWTPVEIDELLELFAESLPLRGAA